ncbi:hypothetical protein JW796_03515 [Candidatus Dojkabacteria bacterium]|nr:hypothetical protein [Candidatus Dojkabacteria bacterium]
MRKLNLTLTISLATLLLTLLLKPVAAQAGEMIVHTDGDAVSAFFAITLTPLWVFVGKLLRRELGD